MTIAYEWRGEFENTAVNALHAEGFGAGGPDVDWHTRVHRYSLGWVCARHRGELVGFVNVVWDGGAHAFIIDTVVAAGLRHRGIGTGLIAAAAGHAHAAGCQWLHVDFEEHLSAFYFQACRFTPTSAGLIALTGDAAPFASGLSGRRKPDGVMGSASPHARDVRVPKRAAHEGTRWCPEPS